MPELRKLVEQYESELVTLLREREILNEKITIRQSFLHAVGGKPREIVRRGRKPRVGAVPRRARTRKVSVRRTEGKTQILGEVASIMAGSKGPSHLKDVLAGLAHKGIVIDSKNPISSLQIIMKKDKRFDYKKRNLFALAGTRAAAK